VGIRCAVLIASRSLAIVAALRPVVAAGVTLDRRGPRPRTEGRMPSRA
jgi:hypothetical protein